METGQSVQPNTKNQASSRRSQPADIEHSESTDNIGEMAPPRLPPGPGSNTQALSEPKNYLTSTKLKPCSNRNRALNWTQT